MRHNDNFQGLALRLMKDRLQQLRGQNSLTEAEQALITELVTWVESKHVRQCIECRGVGMVRFAYTAVIGNKSFLIGRADEDQAGHCPQARFGEFRSLQAAQEGADALNEANGLDKKTAYSIVTSTIRAQHIRERASETGLRR